MLYHDNKSDIKNQWVSTEELGQWKTRNELGLFCESHKQYVKMNGEKIVTKCVTWVSSVMVLPCTNAGPKSINILLLYCNKQMTQVQIHFYMQKYN